MGIETIALIAGATGLLSSATGTIMQMNSANDAKNAEERKQKKIREESLKVGPSKTTTSKGDLLDTNRQSQLRQGFLNAIKVGQSGIQNLNKQVDVLNGYTGLKTKLGE